jgi:hypothetical protein
MGYLSVPGDQHHVVSAGLLHAHQQLVEDQLLRRQRIGVVERIGRPPRPAWKASRIKTIGSMSSFAFFSSAASSSSPSSSYTLFSYFEIVIYAMRKKA